MRNLHLILGDQLDHRSTIFEGFDSQQDSLWMAESNGENTQVKHHKHQIIMFLAAMRHFAEEQRKVERPILYTELPLDGRRDRARELGELLLADLREHRPAAVKVVRPGDRRVLEQLRRACSEAKLQLEVLEDSHFFTAPEDFKEHAKGRKTLRLEFFYRELRTRFDYLIDSHGQPVGGQWNYDSDNRETFGKDGPSADIPRPLAFPPTDTVKDVQALVDARYPDHPGKTENFALPVTRAQGLKLLDDFLENRLANFGDYQDAMWAGEFFLYHSRLSSAINLKLLHPKEVCDRAEAAYHSGQAPLNAVEGFIRQILGWREYIRGIYWTQPADYRERNYLEHRNDLPHFFWTGDTSMACLADTIKGVLENAYSHHIQRLMVSGLFCLLHGVEPRQFNDWHLATHCDAIDWVSTPNVIGMSQFADGGLLASKPYCASGNYIHKMGNYCKTCRYNPKEALGEKACPLTTLYWDFLRRHQSKLQKNPRLKLQLNHLKKKSKDELDQIARKASEWSFEWHK